MPNNFKEQVWLFFDHEWQFKHIELAPDDLVQDALNDGNTLKSLYDFYDKDNKDGRNTWFLDILNQRQATIKNKLKVLLNSYKNNKLQISDEMIEEIIAVCNDKKNFVEDYCGNNLLKITAPHNIIEQLKEDINKLNMAEWNRHCESNEPTDFVADEVFKEFLEPKKSKKQKQRSR